MLSLTKTDKSEELFKSVNASPDSALASVMQLHELSGSIRSLTTPFDKTPLGIDIAAEQEKAAAEAAEETKDLKQENDAELELIRLQEAYDKLALPLQTSFENITAAFKKILNLVGKLTTFTNGGIGLGSLGAAIGEFEKKSLEDLKKEASKFTSNISSTGEALYKQGKKDLSGIASAFASNFFITEPHQDPIVLKLSETLINTAIKVPFEAVKPPLQILDSAINTVGAAIPGCDIVSPITALIDIVDAIENLATMDIPDETLDKLAALKTRSTGIQSGIASVRAKKPSLAGLTDEEIREAAKKLFEAEQAILDLSKKDVKNAFNDMKPELPAENLKEMETTLWTVVLLISSNIYGVMLALLFGLVGLIFKAFNEIISVIGVPKLPPPLGEIMSLIPNIVSIILVIAGLPMTLCTVVKAIFLRKLKIISLILSPPADLPKLPKAPLPGGPSEESKARLAIADAEALFLAAHAEL